MAKRVPVPRIDVWIKGDSYVADMSGAEGAKGIAELFGTCWLPTPFTQHAKVCDVVCEIERRNPGHDVVYCGVVGGI